MKGWICAVLVLGLAPFLAFPANCCTCEIHGDGSPRSELYHSRAVFLGKVTKVRGTTQSEQDNGYLRYAVTLKIERSWKGTTAGEITVYADLGGCPPYSVHEGQKWLVYARTNWLSIACTRTRKLEDAEEDLRALGKGKAISAELKK
jgi:hypothetical protein